jgi:hypothetical protein
MNIIEFFKDNYKWLLPLFVGLLVAIYTIFIKPRLDFNKQLWKKIQDEIIDEACLLSIKNGIGVPGCIHEEDLDKFLRFASHITGYLDKDNSSYFHFKWVPFFKITRVKRKLKKIFKLRSDLMDKLYYWEMVAKNNEQVWVMNYNVRNGQERIDDYRQLKCIMNEIISEYIKLSKMLG